MNYWITIHWPPFEDELNRIPELELKYDPLDLGFENQLIRGDWVYVYRTKSGPPFEVNGKLIKRVKESDSGIKALYTVKSKGWMERMVIGRRWGGWYAELEETKIRGHIPREKVNEILGLKSNNTFRSFGPRGCGLKQLSKEQSNHFYSHLKGA